ncbi:zf-HC2 domain-containing protein [uncultured Microbulbifer sp.]|uniref:zf-HC2 domain-containing protein n=1 Tax=uncultured Microbulbifer sp. TaxID=348147 RepID=UPI0025DD277A|nr:zf-HC2 domain-containing protein [uncultured Microbulbifer sp.]
MMDCKKATRLASESQERKLKTGEKLELKLHLAICSGCRNFAHQVGILRGLARDYARGEEKAPPQDQPQDAGKSSPEE